MSNEWKEDKNYKDRVPDGVDMSQSEWENLSYDMQYYYAKEGRREQIKESSSNRRDRNRKFAERIKKNNCCRSCGEECSVVLTWHHVDDKKDEVSNMVNMDYSLESIAEEMEKCVLLCSNCHRKVHSGILDEDNLQKGSDSSKEVL